MTKASLPMRPRPTAVEYQPWMALTLALIGIAMGIKMILRLPGMPYNVSGLFQDGGSTLSVTIFAAALIWLGAGPLLLAGWLSRSRYPYLIFPAGLVIVAIVSRTLLKYSVTYESLDDILGTNNLFSRVTNANIWGEFWTHAFLTTNAVDLISYFERRVRFIALYSPLAACLTFGLMPMWGVQASRSHLKSWRTMGLALSALVWLWLSKMVV